jgi:TolB-like protein
VLPFEVMSETPEQAYLARGLGAELTANLSRIAGLTTIGPSPVGTGGLDGMPSLAAARYRLLGDAQRAGERVRLHLALVEATTGEQAWSRRFEVPFGDMPHLAESAAVALADALSVDLSAAERRRLGRRGTSSADAYELFLRAQAELLTRRKAGNRGARELYRAALAIDPLFARALGGIALTYAAEYRNQWTADPRAALARAREAAQAAAHLDPDLPEVLWVLAYVHVREGNHELALEQLDRSLALDPSLADAYALKGGVMTYLGKPASTVPLLSQAMRLNPRAGYLYYLILGRALFFLGAADRASMNLREAAARNPANLEVRIYLAAALTATANPEAAEWEALEIANLAPDFSLAKWLETHPLRDAGHRRRLVAALAQVGL